MRIPKKRAYSSRREFLRGAALGAGGVLVGTRAGAAGLDKPNIVIVLADDLGLGDLSCLNQDSKLTTPQIDSLARDSVRFTDAHSGSSLCTPTRYGLLTGRYCWRTSLKYHVLRPYDPPLIEPERLTLATLLRANGYYTACIGKWHLGWDWPKSRESLDFTKPLTGGPLAHGFDYYFGPDVPNYPPYCFIENNRITEQPTALKPRDDLDGPAGPMAPGYRFDKVNTAIVKKGVSYIVQRAATKKPFFLYLALTIPHEPLRPSRRFAGKSGINEVADLILEMDWSVGEILRTLDRIKLGDNTIVVFASDNGHSSYTGLEQLLARGHYPNGPYRGYKGSIYEGGHRVPLLVKWPGRIAPGTRSDALVCLGDLLPTSASIIGATLGNDEAEDGYDMMPALTGSNCGVRREALVHHSGWGQFAIRRGDFKLIVPKQDPPDVGAEEPKQVELYNLCTDAGETTNVASTHENVVKELRDLLEQYQAEGRSRPHGVWPQTDCGG